MVKATDRQRFSFHCKKLLVCCLLDQELYMSVWKPLALELLIPLQSRYSNSFSFPSLFIVYGVKSTSSGRS